MSTDWIVIDDKTKTYAHLGQRFTAGPSFGYGPNDKEGRLFAAEFITDKIEYGNPLRISVDPAPDGYKEVKHWLEDIYRLSYEDRLFEASNLIDEKIGELIADRDFDRINNILFDIDVTRTRFDLLCWFLYATIPCELPYRKIFHKKIEDLIRTEEDRKNLDLVEDAEDEWINKHK